MKVSIIAAVADNGVIGVNNQLPWKLPADLQHFKAITMGKPIIMGRKTYETIGRALPGRKNIVLTRIKHLAIPNCEVVHSFEDALAAAGDAKEVFVIGGATIYEEALPHATKLYITQVHADIEGDTYFPYYDKSRWQEISRESHDPDPQNEHPYSFLLMACRA